MSKLDKGGGPRPSTKYSAASLLGYVFSNGQYLKSKKLLSTGRMETPLGLLILSAWFNIGNGNNCRG